MHIGFGRIFAAAVVAVGYAAGAAQAQERMVECEGWRAVKCRVGVMRAMVAPIGSIRTILQGKVGNKADRTAHGSALGVPSRNVR
jgi:hypothetical protein